MSDTIWYKVMIQHQSNESSHRVIIQYSNDEGIITTNLNQHW